MNVLAFHDRHTRERIQAYYVLLSFAPELAHASAVVRTSEVERVIAGLREAERALSPDCDAISRKGRDQALALMRADAEATVERLKAGGF